MIKSIKVFLVDDEPHVRMYLRTILKAYPVDIVAECGQGGEAVDGYRQMRPDLVLMDISMPHKTGLEALEEILAIDPMAKVVLLTSISDRQSIRDALRKGAVQYIRKDTPIEEIKRSLEGLFETIGQLS